MAVLNEAEAGDDPLVFFVKWFSEAENAGIDEINAMTVATVDAGHKPHARVVLLKGIDHDGFVFYTNYDSNKGREIDANHFITAVFFWKELERQVRIEGIAEKVSNEESDLYFSTRPLESQLGAWSSPQSHVIPSRNIIEENFRLYQQQYHKAVPRPPHWGGYRIIPHRIEFWQGRSNRMHDRILFINEGGRWSKCRLAP